MSDLDGCWHYHWRTPETVFRVSFYQEVKNCREAPAITATRSHFVLNCFRTEINAWLCRKMPGVFDRVGELVQLLLDELPLQHLASRTAAADSTLGVVHVLHMTKYIKIGASSLELHPRRRHQALLQRLQTYKRGLMDQECRLEYLPVMVVTRSAAQALLLEGFMRRYMRHFEPQTVVSSSVSNSVELYRPEARDVILQQLRYRSKRSARQLRIWMAWFDEQHGRRVDSITEEDHPQEAHSLDL